MRDTISIICHTNFWEYWSNGCHLETGTGPINDINNPSIHPISNPLILCQGREVLVLSQHALARGRNRSRTDGINNASQFFVWISNGSVISQILLQCWIARSVRELHEQNKKTFMCCSNCEKQRESCAIKTAPNCKYMQDRNRRWAIFWAVARTLYFWNLKTAS